MLIILVAAVWISANRKPSAAIAWILAIMPFFLAGVMNLVNPDFMRPLWTDPIGHSIIKWTLGMMLVGILVMRKIVKIRY